MLTFLLSRAHMSTVCLELQLATGDFDDRWAPIEVAVRIDGDESCFCRTVQIAAGLQHTLALIAHKGRVKPFAAGWCYVRLNADLLCQSSARKSKTR